MRDTARKPGFAAEYFTFSAAACQYPPAEKTACACHYISLVLNLFPADRTARYIAGEENLTVLSIYGSEDGVLNIGKVAEGKAIVCGEYRELVIEGGNHAQFGSYGEQAGDGKAKISAAEQWQRTAEFILNNK